METLNRPTKARGVINATLCITLTLVIGRLIVDQPITAETSAILRIDNIVVCAYLSAFFLSTTISMVMTFFIGMMIPGADLETTRGFMSNPLSKFFCYVGFITWVILGLVAVFSWLQEMAK